MKEMDDAKVKKFFEEWLSEKKSGNEYYFKLAQSRYIINNIYSEIPCYRVEESSNFSYAYIKQKLKKALFLILWLIKWLMFRKKNNPVILLHLSLHKRCNRDYLEALLEENRFDLILLGICTELGLLKSRKFFCMPFFSFKKKKLEEYESEIIAKTSKKIYNEFKIKLDKRLFESNALKYKGYLEYTKRACNFISSNQIKVFINDFDYTELNPLLVNYFKNRNVKTLSLDHSLAFFNHIYYRTASQFYCVWGEAGKRRLIDYCSIPEDKIHIVGKPDAGKISGNAATNKYWLYFLPAFNHPLFYSFEKNIEISINYVKILLKYIELHHPEIKLHLKFHPSDSHDLVKKFPGEAIIVKSIDKSLVPKIVFSEETSVFPEYLYSDAELIIISGANNREMFPVEMFSDLAMTRNYEKIYNRL